MSSYKKILFSVGSLVIIGLTAFGVWLGFLSTPAQNLTVVEEVAAEFVHEEMIQDYFPELFIRYRRPIEWGNPTYAEEPYESGILRTITYPGKPGVMISSYEGPKLSVNHPQDMPLLFQGFESENGFCSLRGWNTPIGECDRDDLEMGEITSVLTQLPWVSQEQHYVFIDYSHRFPHRGMAVTYEVNNDRDKAYAQELFETWDYHFVMEFPERYENH